MDWTATDEAMAREIVREGEAYLQGQVAIATSADQRAVVLAGIYIATGTAILVALIAAVGKASPPAPIIAGGIVWALFFLAGGGLCIGTALPVDFYLPGTFPSKWYADVAEGKALTTGLGEMAQAIDEEIADNNAVIERNARRYRRGALIGLFAPVAAAAAWGLAALIEGLAV